MFTSRKERRAQSAMRTLMGIGGMTAISLLIMASPAQAQPEPGVLAEGTEDMRSIDARP